MEHSSIPPYDFVVCRTNISFDQWRTECSGFGVQTPPTEIGRPSKIVPNKTRLWKFLKLLNLGHQQHKMLGKKFSQF